MTRIEQAHARMLVAELAQTVDAANRRTVRQLQKLLGPPPTLGRIILAIPSESHTERAELIGRSRQGYYNLIQGLARPNSETVRRIAELTGLPEEQILEAAP